MATVTISGTKVDPEICNVDRDEDITFQCDGSVFEIEFADATPDRKSDRKRKSKKDAVQRKHRIRMKAMNEPGTYAYVVRVGTGEVDPAIIIRR